MVGGAEERAGGVPLDPLGAQEGTKGKAQGTDLRQAAQSCLLLATGFEVARARSGGRRGRGLRRRVSLAENA